MMTRYDDVLPIQCRSCGAAAYYNTKYDSYGCPRCNQWRSATCNDPGCTYCKDRPEYPSQADDYPPEEDSTSRGERKADI